MFEFSIHCNPQRLKHASDAGILRLAIPSLSRAAEGFANHAGTTAMADRHDALLSASRFVEAVKRELQKP